MAPRTAVCEAFRAWIVLPQAKVVLVNVGALANHARGTCPAASRRCRHSTTRADCCPEPPKMMTSVSNRMALAAASSASRNVLPPTEGRRFESCRARHFPKEFADCAHCLGTRGEGAGEKSDRSPSKIG